MDLIKLNIGGTHHLTCDKAVLRSVPGSFLSKLFNELHALKVTDEGEVFLDRDGKTFETLLNYLRDDRKVFPEFMFRHEETMFFKELQYWNIDTEHKEWHDHYLA